ncbi:sulfite dehydrogenase [Neopusillimonas maritima]|uniref:Sulfite dehydrogenase n=1 Tax=Neopusillimonas maritima TaxID=2026239 RepID=A0ABX9MXU4_9BURK|nr:sulfite dehydrogenase [Neopusillimonas maritima]MBF23621.1 sulfite dehydrogenase [Pusillimonas sp.]RII83795.1 sulfite dehydrogenase [Neopusillimonas maritima]|tara:strand:+ start:12254 stop:13651 length:1398 start_codon:yes stop_codon:yes gene_type:complete
MKKNPSSALPPGSTAQHEALQAKEEIFLAQERQNPESPYYQGNADPAKQRRRFLLGSVAVLGAGALARPAFAEAPPGAIEREVFPDPTKHQGVGVGVDDGGYGRRSQFETEVRWRYPTKTTESSWSMTPLASGMGIITPSGLHYERHHGGITTIDPAKHVLYVHGMVKEPKKYHMEAIRRFPMMSRICFLECSGNGLTEWIKPTLKSVQGTHGLTSTSEWTGVPLSTILDESVLKSGAKWLLAEGGDAAVMTRSIPIEKAMADCFLAYGQNGEAIRPEQGYPLRLVVPGYEGNMCIKWLRRLEVSDTPFMTREETSKYTDLMPDGTALQFSFTMEAKSVITYPSGEMLLQKPGFYEITGLAWSGRGLVKKVEVSVDGGKNWREAKLHGPILPMCHTRFTIPWEWDGKKAILQSRCIDETGYVQPTIGELIEKRGTNGPLASVYHLNGIQSWKVASTGEVTNVHHY